MFTARSTPSPQAPRYWLTGLAYMLLLGVVIAGFLSLLGGRFGVNLVYSYAIGTVCWLMIETLRRGTHAVWLRSRARQTGAASPDGTQPPSGWGSLLLAVALTVAIGPSIGLSLGDLLTGSRSPNLWQLESPGSRITLAITLLATLVTVGFFSARARLARSQARAEALQREAAEAQLRLLQSQLEPHMLFNTLANLRVLIGLDPARAQAMLDRLIAYLRATLTASRQDSHPLAAEFARVEDFLALMAVRMGPRLQTRLVLPEALGSTPVPPLLLQPLVENCIKHGLEPKLEGGRVEVGAERAGDRLVLTVRDTGVGVGPEPQTSAPGTHFGLQQVRERLHTLYGDRASLRLEAATDTDGGTLATLTLPQ